jgi:hypothetical protein
MTDVATTLHPEYRTLEFTNRDGTKIVARQARMAFSASTALGKAIQALTECITSPFKWFAGSP